MAETEKYVSAHASPTPKTGLAARITQDRPLLCVSNLLGTFCRAVSETGPTHMRLPLDSPDGICHSSHVAPEFLAHKQRHAVIRQARYGACCSEELRWLTTTALTLPRFRDVAVRVLGSRPKAIRGGRCDYIAHSPHIKYPGLSYTCATRPFQNLPKAFNCQFKAAMSQAFI